MKLSIIVPVYYNKDNLKPLYEDIYDKVIKVIDYEYEIIMVDDGSRDGSFDVMKELAEKDDKIKVYRLSRNFGSHAAILCGLEKCSGDCAVIKAADLQEPSEMIIQMVDSWKKGNNVVLAAREGRDEKKSQTFFSNMYYRMVQKTAFPQMPDQGFDIFLIDRKVIEVLSRLDERNSALTGQILWSGFKTDTIYYVRKAREIGKSRWTLKKKCRLVSDTLFSFSTLPITVVSFVGVISFIGALIWAIIVAVAHFSGEIPVQGWTTLFIFNLLSFGIIMMTLGIIGNYLWRTFDASRNRPPYIIEIDDKERDYRHDTSKIEK